METDPTRSILPVVVLDSDDRPIRLLGTCFVLGGNKQVAVTAAHVFGFPRDMPKDQVVKVDPSKLASAIEPRGVNLGLAVKTGHNKIRTGRIRALITSTHVDVGITFVDESFPVEPLAISPEEIPLNHDVLCFEYSRSRSQIEPSAGVLQLAMNPVVHKGNIMRYHEEPFFRWPPVRSFDTSFPAIGGASGAPILRHDGAVVGMVVANTQEELIPVQVTKTRLQGKDYEEIRYYAPNAGCLSAQPIIDQLRRHGIEPAIAASPDSEADQG